MMPLFSTPIQNFYMLITSIFFCLCLFAFVYDGTYTEKIKYAAKRCYFFRCSLEKQIDKYLMLKDKGTPYTRKISQKFIVSCVCLWFKQPYIHEICRWSVSKLDDANN